MAKNELLPFADGEDANVLPTNQWEALTDILENGFQSGIARSEQVNRVLAQGAVASYVLGQLIVDQLNKNATLDKDTLYQNLVSALQENAKDVCLPLSGGTMTDTITTSVTRALVQSGTSGCTGVYGGTHWNTGGYIALYGKDSSGNEGNIHLEAHNGTQSTKLTLKPEGTLTWGGHHVLQYLNPYVWTDAPTDGTVYTIPWDCYGFFECTRDNSGSGTMWIKVNGNDVTSLTSDDFSNPKLSLPLKKGQTLQITSDGRLTGMWVKLVAIGG